ncbi:MAG TPA: universal stress protein [Desulfovibrio sp.]|nr:universal stress protein [Desulfovibrio sp.]
MAQIKKILCAVDLSEHSPAVADYAKTLAQGLNAQVLCLYVAPSLSQYVGFHVPPSSIENFVGEIVSGADATMNAFLAEQFPGVKVEGRVVTGYAAEEVLNLAEEQGVDLIIMGTHGRTGLDHVLFGSTAEKVVRKSAIPVMTIRYAE